MLTYRKISKNFLPLVLSLGLFTLPNISYSRLPDTSEVHNYQLLVDRTLKAQLQPQFAFFPGCGNFDSFEDLEQILRNIGNNSSDFRFTTATINENSSFFPKRVRMIGLLPTMQGSYIFRRSPDLEFSVTEDGRGYFLRRDLFGVLRFRYSNLTPDFFCNQVEEINGNNLN